MVWSTPENLPPLSPLSPPSCLHLPVPIIWMGTHGHVPQWQVPETHSDYPNPSSHIHSGSHNSWCAGSFPASPFIRSGIRVSLFVSVKWGGRAACPCQVHTVWWRDLRKSLVPALSMMKTLIGSNLDFVFLVSTVTLRRHQMISWLMD